MYILTMTLDEWDAVADHPRQRNIPRHAKKVADLFHPWEEIGEVVQAAVMPDKELVKLNGHTRSYLWQRNDIYRPALVYVEVHEAKDEAHLEKMYYLFDNVKNVENSEDIMTGCLNGLDIVPKSSIFQLGRCATAVKYLAMEAIPGSNSRLLKTSAYEAVSEWQDEIVTVDEMIIGRPPSRVPAWILAAMLISFRKHGEGVRGFWEDYLDPDTELLSNSPPMLLRLALERSKGTGSGYGNLRKHTAKALAATERHVVGGTGTLLRGIKIDSYLGRKKSAAVSQERLRQLNLNNLEETRVSP